MSRHTRTICCLVATLGIGLSSQALAWTPYGYGPYGPGYQGGYPEILPLVPSTGSGTYHQGAPAADDPSGAYAGQPGDPYGTRVPESPYGEPSAPPAPRQRGYSGYGSWPAPSWGYPDTGRRGFGAPPGFRIKRSTSEDAYGLTIELQGMSPEEVQIETGGQWLRISRESSAHQVQKDSFDDGRGFVRSFSYSTGTSSRRLSVPGDGDLSAMSREDGEGSIHIRIPRHRR